MTSVVMFDPRPGSRFEGRCLGLAGVGYCLFGSDRRPHQPDHDDAHRRTFARMGRLQPISDAAHHPATDHMVTESIDEKFLHRKRFDCFVSHCVYFPSKGATVRRRTPVEGTSYDNFVDLGNLNRHATVECVVTSRVFRNGTRPASRCTAFQPMRDTSRDRARDCGRGLPVRSTMLSGVGVCSSWANQASDGVAGQNDLGKKASLSLFSVAASSSQRAASSLVIGLPSRSTSRAASARRATPTSSSQASRNRTLSRFTRSMAHCSRSEIPAAGYAALGRGPRNPRTLIIGSGGGLAISLSDGGDCRSLPPGEIEPSVTLASLPSESIFDRRAA